jgi:hypothetical protein
MTRPLLPDEAERVAYIRAVHMAEHAVKHAVYEPTCEACYLRHVVLPALEEENARLRAPAR